MFHSYPYLLSSPLVLSLFVSRLFPLSATPQSPSLALSPLPSRLGSCQVAHSRPFMRATTDPTLSSGLPQICASIKQVLMRLAARRLRCIRGASTYFPFGPHPRFSNPHHRCLHVTTPPHQVVRFCDSL